MIAPRRPLSRWTSQCLPARDGPGKLLLEGGAVLVGQLERTSEGFPLLGLLEDMDPHAPHFAGDLRLASISCARGVPLPSRQPGQATGQPLLRMPRPQAGGGTAGPL